MSTEPGPATFGTRIARPMYAAFYGELVPHAPLTELSQDAYSLFYSRSAAMGWLTPAVEGASGGVWGMNDAEVGPALAPRPDPVAWFQVTLTEPAGTGVLPVQPFLACAGDVMARLGTLRLEAVQVLVPGQDAPADGDFASPSSMPVARPLLASLNWFGDRGPRLREPARVTLDGGPDPQVTAAAPAIARWIGKSARTSSPATRTPWPITITWSCGPPPCTGSLARRTTGSPSTAPSPSGHWMRWDGWPPSSPTSVPAMAPVPR